ncbi:MAG: histidine kinase [Bacteroidetes bacterium]|nr:histidine kinase [Bacteroidota bacterium]
MRLKKIIVLFFILFVSETKAQQYFFKNYSVENGLPFVQVSCMYQDKNGYLWSGGYGGLSRFDGKEFLNFNRKNGLINQNVNAICEDDAQNIYVGTNKGLSVLSGQKFSNYGKEQGLQSPLVTALCKCYSNSVYVGTTKGLYVFKDKKISPVQKFQDYKITCLYNPDTSVICAGTDKGLIFFGDETFEILDTKNGLASDKITGITKFKNFLAVATDKGLSLYDFSNKKITNYFTEQGLIDENITSLVSQNNQFLWIGSQSGLLRFDGKTFDYYNVASENNSNVIIVTLNDREDNIWLGTHNGLYRYRDNSFSTFNKDNGLDNAFVYQIFRDKRGELWVCSFNGIYKNTQGYFKRYTIADGLPHNTSSAGIEDKEGRLIFGTDGGVVQFRNERFETIPLPPEFKPPHSILYLSRNNTLWIGGSNGFVSLVWEKNIPKTKFYPIADKTDFEVLGFCEDDAQNLYIGVYKGGLFKFSNGEVINLGEELNLGEENFLMLRFIKDHLFASSLNGLYVINTKTNSVKRISEDERLNSDLIYSIEFAENKNALWIGTNQGINKLNLKRYLNEDVIELASFGKQEGFAGVEANSNGIWEDKDGTLWFGTVSGLIKHQPFNFKKNKIENVTLIQNIEVMNEDTLLQNGAVLPSDFNTITFHYGGICLTNPDKVLYQKKLEGLDKDWSAGTSEDYIKYTNLAPGKYTFKVRSCNNEGVWNTMTTTFSFQIKYPFYLTWWFILLSIIGILALIYLIFMLRIINIKRKQQQDFERKVEMSKTELKALRSQMNPHFIFNSLNSIQHYIFNAKSDEAIKYLNKFARLVRLILNNSNKPTVTIEEDLEALKLYLELEQMRFEEQFDYELIIDKTVDLDYDIMPPLLMQPYVENAIIHGLNTKPEKGKLTIHLTSENNFLICTITDNGIGRAKAAEIKRTMPYKKHQSMGMKITEERLKILNEINNSQLSVTITDLKSSNDEALGTQVKLFVPLNG